MLSQNFNKTGLAFSQGDLNYDGRTNALDFSLLATKFGISLPADPLSTAPINEGNASALVAVAPPTLFSEEPVRRDDALALTDLL